MNDNQLVPQNQESAMSSDLMDVRNMPTEVLQLAAALWASLKDGNGNAAISKPEALRAAIHAERTGEVFGRDSYIGTAGNVKGQVLEGYRAIQSRIETPYTVQYRPPTVQENTDHEIKTGWQVVMCDVYVLDVWRRCIKMNVPYQPITGIGVVTPAEKQKKDPPQGKTWRWVAEKRARKDALRQLPAWARDPFDWNDGDDADENGATRQLAAADAAAQEHMAELQELPSDELQARKTANVNAMRGDPNADPFQDAPPPPGVTPEQDFADMPSATEEHAAQQAERDSFVPTCPVCDGAMWDNREGKKNPKAPDFKCKDKECNGAIWLPETPEKGRAAMFANVKAIYGDNTDEFKTWLQERYHVASSKELTLNQLAEVVARLKQQQPA